ncbi:MAG: hypothetical protein SWZ49_29220 [Cyanobacteriota bacterium]|jgi:hypothetical protein|nr:hypothetical protein [Cyanobacteriota bacterium]
MDTLIEQLNVKLRQWQPDIAQQVRQSIKEIIELADCDALDISRSAKPCGYSRTVEQEVLDILDEPETR